MDDQMYSTMAHGLALIEAAGHHVSFPTKAAAGATDV